MLAALGLDLNEQSTYVALVDRSPTTLADLRAAAGIEHGQLVAALESLENHGLVTRHPGTPARYAAVDPEIALDLLILYQEEQLKRARLAAQELANRFRDGQARRDPAELIEVVSGREAAARRVLHTLRTARREVRFIDRPPYLVPFDGMSDIVVDHLSRDLCYRGIYDAEGLASDAHELRGDMELTISKGEAARVLPNAPIKLLLIDDRYACLPLQAAPEQFHSMVVVHPSGLLEALSALFEALWERAFPLSLVDDAPEPGPSPADRRLLALLAAGMADSAAAKHLDISPRTYHRRLQELMTQLGAETRFQAGLQAALLGWIERPSRN